ncbi:MAG: hypothetical protein IH599_06580, partial [Bacteroidales bacterium]|nr:hypothetical protein [Bacteroidales bacterium]
MKKPVYLILLSILFLTARIPGKVSLSEGKKCSDCHSSVLHGMFIHGPAKYDCELCHKPTGQSHPGGEAPAFEFPADGAEMCYYCHESKNTLPIVHAVVEGGECTVCHLPHSADVKFLLAGEPASYLCEGCHDMEIAEKNFTHKPASDGQCTSCHDPHQSAYSHLLTYEPRDGCIYCHKSMITELERPFVHKPVLENCSICHNPHASTFPSLLRRSFPQGDYFSSGPEGVQQCYSCHEPLAMVNPSTTTLTSFRDGSKNLHYLHLSGPKGRSCVLCHNVHAADNSSLIAQEVRFGKWTMRMNFLQTGSGGSCLPGCHGELS